MQSPLVSVLMPAYNAELYIGEAIESILNQTFKDFEFIIVDDASTDKTWETINKYAKKDKRIRAYQNKKNLKISLTLNKGIKATKGKYIARMDADDWSYPYRLNKQVDFMENNPEVVICGGTMNICDSRLRILAKREYPKDNDRLKKIIFRHSPFCHPSVIYRTDIAVKVKGYFDQYNCAEDIDFYFKMGQHGKFSNLSIPLIKYRTVPGSISHRYEKRQEIVTIQSRFYAVKKYGYKMSFFDKIYNCLQYISIFIIPPVVKIWLFNKLRNS
ncbi:glycosyltransferase family 2 protein [Candidatus Roizmanbacteria bacterium]|nr:glycosyltransferase family 2 protein [Candidatus Roizmanbacteria bacterium]